MLALGPPTKNWRPRRHTKTTHWNFTTGHIGHKLQFHLNQLILSVQQRHVSCRGGPSTLNLCMLLFLVDHPPGILALLGRVAALKANKVITRMRIGCDACLGYDYYSKILCTRVAPVLIHINGPLIWSQ